METSTLDRHRADHDRVRAILTGLEAYLLAAAPPVDAGFSRLRWSLARELSVHLAFERTAYPKITSQPRGPALYNGLDRTLDADLGEHMTKWTLARIHAEWIAYRVSARLLSRRLRQRMAYEESVLFPMMAPAA
ncbi:hypothetical protein ASG29_15230 [Sphingomonas sp. Leaf412]|uniref:hemerythrin domain-containing protein n=1 Tax=Sphingomonas sp. Leaf412 TaxID=1736370 RepID=UPI0006F33A32|nr:hemerythrin domain-containing protein [Sphingomonas sp. Leaf412]KQT31310.1 hypothetical protein ASG29_15230 [Sphingomonas sp. Leaf412]